MNRWLRPDSVRHMSVTTATRPEQPLRDPVRGDGLLHHRDRPLGRLTRRDVGGDGVTGVVVDELEDHACPAAGEDVVGRVQLPARVRGGIDESSVGGPRLLPRLGPGDVRVAEDSRQRRCRGNRGHSQVAHLLVDADRPVIQPGLLQCGADPDRLLLDVLGDPVRARPGPSAARLKSRGLPLLERPSPDRVEGLPRRWRARGRTCSPGPAAHPVATARSPDGHEDQPGRSGPASNIEAKCHHQRAPKRHRSIDVEASPMSRYMTSMYGLYDASGHR